MYNVYAYFKIEEEKMNIILYIMIFIMGTVFGSFFTLAVYRIPLKRDITHERSFCPNCNHRLEFLDLIPVLSYIFLKGKCRYCDEKVRIRYLVLEILSGVVFLLGYISLNIKNPILELSKISYFISFVFIYITIVLVAGIDKEYRKINKQVVAFGVVMQIMYILYLCILENTSIYGYGIYLFTMFVLFLINYIIKNKKGDSLYLIEILIFCTYLNMCVGSYLFLIIAIISVLIIILYSTIHQIRYKMKDKADILNENIKKELPIGFFIGITTVAVIIIENFLIY